MRQVLPLGAWEPDAADLGSDTLDIARNTLPAAKSWKPAPSLITQTTALPTAPKGVFYAQNSDGSYITLAGTATKLYLLNSADQTWTDISRLVGGAYAVPTESFWVFTQFQKLVIATQLGDVPQVYDVDAGGNFAALAGSPPQAKFVDVVEDRVVLWNLLSDPRGMQWSDVEDATEWATGLAGDQSFTSYGPIQAICAAAGLIIQEQGLRSIIPTGDTDSFQFDEIASTKGTIAPYGVIKFQALAAWLTEDGYYLGNASEQRPISNNRITKYFFEEVFRDRLWQVMGTHDPFEPRIYWSYPTADTAYNERLLGYDWSLDKWFEVLADTYMVARTATAGVTLESLDALNPSIDAMLFSFDSRVLQGGAPVFGAFDPDFKLAYFEGPAMAPKWRLSNHHFGDGYRVRLRKAMPLIEGPGGSSATVSIAKRQRLADTLTFGTPVPVQTSGWARLNHDGFFHQIEIDIPAAADWSHAMAVFADFERTSER